MVFNAGAAVLNTYLAFYCLCCFFREEYLAKIERRIKDYKIDVINEPRPGKKLLVLDVDYTLFGKQWVSP